MQATPSKRKTAILLISFSLGTKKIQDVFLETACGVGDLLAEED